MALIKCPECGKEISSSAASCPNCGYPIRGPLPKAASYSDEEIDKLKSELKRCQQGALTCGIIGSISFVLMLAMLFVGFFEYVLICQVLTAIFAFFAVFMLLILLPINSTMLNNRAKIINEYNKYKKDGE